MSRTITSIAAVCVLLPTVQLSAEQMVVLKSGATLIGDVAFDNGSVVIQIAEGKLRVEMAEIVAIATLSGAGGGSSGATEQAQQLLMKALEARLMNGAGEEVLGILAEAARLAPDDPRVAFWYASTLLDAGHGRAASEVFEQQRAAITKNYLAMAGRLESRIKQRVELEGLPNELVDRIDKFNAIAENQSLSASRTQMFAMFRIVDQKNVPLEKSSFSVQYNGQNDKLESFVDGYCLFTYTLSSRSDDVPCKLVIREPGFVAKSIEFHGAANRVENVGVFTVSRYEESARKPIRMQVFDPKGQPVSGATVSLRPDTGISSSSDDSLRAKTDAEGKAEILAYPFKYSYTVSANGCKAEQGALELTPAQDGVDVLCTIYSGINGSIRVAWTSALPLVGEGTASGETTVPFPVRSFTHGQSSMQPQNWVRPMQSKDQLVLVLIGGQYQLSERPGVEEPWIRHVKIDVPEDSKDRITIAKKEFDAIDVNKIHNLKQEHEPAKMNNDFTSGSQGSIALTAELGDIFIGCKQFHDYRGQVVTVYFKALVEELGSSMNPGK